MAEKRYYWMRLKPTFFTSKEIKKLRRIAGGDTFVIIYLKMQLLSLETDGKLYYDGVEDNFAEEIALELDEDADNVQMTIAYLEKCGLIEQSAADEYYLPEVSENTGSETAAAGRMRKSRKRNIVTLECNDVTVECNNVTPMLQDRYTEKEKEKDNRDIYNISPDFSKKSAVKSAENAEINAEFEQIWKLYPRKEEKKRALSAYVKARTKKDNPCTFEQVLAGVERYRKHTANKESQYIKTGATWFNGECWNDEYPSQTSPEKPVDPEIEKYKVLINKF